MTQEQKNKSTSAPAEEAQTEPVDQRDPELDQEVDDLLDAIDEVLEENAEEFVNAFVQKGGE